MMRKSFWLLTTATIAFSGTAVASEIYKWTDENGTVHYVDRPVSDDAERVAIASSRSSNSSVQASIDARRARDAARQESREQQEEEARRAEELAQLAAEREQKCQDSRERMERYLTARRLYKEDENGERVYLNDNEILDARSAAQEDIQAYCN